MQSYHLAYAHLLESVSAESTCIPAQKAAYFQNMIETAPSHVQGDVALPCFSFASICKKSPALVAQELAQALENKRLQESQKYVRIKSVDAVGPYCNITLSLDLLTESVVHAVLYDKPAYGEQIQKKPQTILIESPSPNTNKPLHLGHVRNMLLGTSLVNVWRALGHEVKNVEVVNDRGIHICKSMLAYKLFAQDAQPDKKSDHFVGDRYVRFAQENVDDSLMNQAQEMLQQRESGNKEIRALWEMMNEWASSGHQETYERYGTKIDRAHKESDVYQQGKEIALKGLQQGIFEKDAKGNIVYYTDKDQNTKIVLLRSDGTALYATQDLALAFLRYQEFAMDKMVYVVGSEQKYYFSQLFQVFKALGYSFVDSCYHASYGMIYLPDGKMKSREGNVVDADTLADQIQQQAYQTVQERYPDMQKQELHARAESIAMAAIKFYILQYDSNKDITFDPKESLRFDGETGPYVQYTVARAASLLDDEKAQEHIHQESVLTPPSTLTDQERQAMKEVYKHLSRYPDIVQKAAYEYNPSHIPHYLIDLCHSFNSLYQRHKIFQGETERVAYYLQCVQMVYQVLAHGLQLLGIHAPRSM